MANIHFNSSAPKYVGARASVERVEEGVKITLSDYKGTTSETIAEAIESIEQTQDGRLLFTLPNGNTFLTDPLKGEKGEKGDPGSSENTTYQVAIKSVGSSTDLVLRDSNNAEQLIPAVLTSEVGAADGVCPLDVNGKVDSMYLPSGGGGGGGGSDYSITQKRVYFDLADFEEVEDGIETYQIDATVAGVTSSTIVFVSPVDPFGSIGEYKIYCVKQSANTLTFGTSSLQFGRLLADLEEEEIEEYETVAFNVVMIKGGAS